MPRVYTSMNTTSDRQRITYRACKKQVHKIRSPTCVDTCQARDASMHDDEALWHRDSIQGPKQTSSRMTGKKTANLRLSVVTLKRIFHCFLRYSYIRRYSQLKSSKYAPCLLLSFIQLPPQIFTCFKAARATEIRL